MNRALFLGLILLAGGCQAAPERLSLKPLPESSPPLPYAELLTRARLQASAATEAFYVNQWTDLEDAARGLQQTARFLGRAVEIPAKQKDGLPKIAENLGKEAAKLAEAARAKDEKQANEVLRQINIHVRELRLE